ncbi:MAG: hypothetical protein HYY55_03175 [Candidatus Niyogibacteria bacterium]|nr:MAG: hypothetical protein HYY55_03175 [Candidatus Niyogibacteria bacterium]
MEVEKLIGHPSLQREFKRFRQLGGSVRIDGDKIVLFSEIIPIEVAQDFAERIRSLDEEKKLEVTVQTEA